MKFIYLIFKRLNICHPFVTHHFANLCNPQFIFEHQKIKIMMRCNSFSAKSMGQKIFFTLIVWTCVYINAFSQVSINNTNAVPHTSSMLDISSNNKGLLIPRMSITELTAITSPAEGLLVYVNSGATGLYQYRSGNWEKLFAFNGSLSNGGVLFGSNASFTQNNSHFFWNDTQKYLGLGTNTPNAPLTVSSLLPPTGNATNSNWIVANFGANSGSRLLFGTREGIPTIGAASSALLTWDTLSLNPGGPIKMPYYAGQSPLLLSTNTNGTVKAIKTANGVDLQNDTLQLGGLLSKNTAILLNNKNFTFKGGSPSPTITVSNYSNTNISTNINTSFGQSFVAQNNGILTTISIIMGLDFGTPYSAQYFLYEGNGNGGPLLKSGLFQMPYYNFGSFVDIAINHPVVAGQSYTLIIGTLGAYIRYDLTENNQYPAGNLYLGASYTDLIYDLKFKVTELESFFDLVAIDGQAKSMAINVPANKLKIASLAGNGTRNVTVASDGTIGSSIGIPGTVSTVTGTAPIQVTNNSTTPQIAITQANASTSGYLSATDWSTFNNKQNVLSNANGFTSGILTSADWNTFNNKVGTATAVNTTAPLTGGGTLGSSLTLSMTQANSSTNGYLSSADWNTFSNKYNLPSLTAGSILFSNGSNIEQSNAQLYWNNTTKSLGIGTATPTSGLHINGYEYNLGLKITNSTESTVGPAIFLEGANRSYAIINSNNLAGSGPQKLGFYDDKAGQYRLVIDSTGNLGLGDVNPDKKLVVNGQGGLKVTSSHPGNGYSDWVAGNFGGSGDQRVVIGQFDNIATIGAHNTALDQWRDLAINPSATGNVGIGTTSPAYKLDVNGSQRVTGDLNVTGKVKQSVHQMSISIPAAIYPVINPFAGGSTTPTYGETTAIWVHNLGYNPVIMTSFDFSAGGFLHHVNVSYRHADNNTIEFYFSNTSVNVASGLINIIVVN